MRHTPRRSRPGARHRERHPRCGTWLAASAADDDERRRGLQAQPAPAEVHQHAPPARGHEGRLSRLISPRRRARRVLSHRSDHPGRCTHLRHAARPVRKLGPPAPSRWSSASRQAGSMLRRSCTASPRVKWSRGADWCCRHGSVHMPSALWHFYAHPCARLSYECSNRRPRNAELLQRLRTHAC